MIFQSHSLVTWDFFVIIFVAASSVFILIIVCFISSRSNGAFCPKSFYKNLSRQQMLQESIKTFLFVQIFWIKVFDPTFVNINFWVSKSVIEFNFSPFSITTKGLNIDMFEKLEAINMLWQKYFLPKVLLHQNTLPHQCRQPDHKHAILKSIFPQSFDVK